MQGITAFVILALTATTWAASPPAMGTWVDCSQYNAKGAVTACPRIFQQICGSDQQTYNNECMLCMKSREKGIELRKLHDGQCVECAGYSSFCTMDYRPLCGSDNTVYGNQCTFCNAVVKSRGALYLAKYGAC